MAIRCPGNEKGEIQLESPDSGVVCSIFVTALPIEVRYVLLRDMSFLQEKVSKIHENNS